MFNKKIIASLIAAIVLLTAGGVALRSNGPDVVDTIKNIVNDLPLPDKQDPVLPVEDVKKETIPCFDFIDGLLKADGFTYLSGTKWGRGEKNFFVIDIAKQQFQIADVYNTNVLPIDWYDTEFQRYVQLIYHYGPNEITVEAMLRGNEHLRENKEYYTRKAESFMVPTDTYYELPLWMDRYVKETEKFGCPIVGITKEQLLGEYKTKMSKAEAKDIISSFDLVSTDGKIRYFKDAHKIGSVQDEPRYKEITTLKEYAQLYDASGFEGFYMINVMYHNPSKFVYERDRNGLQASVIDHFIKDVVYVNTPHPDNEEKQGTIGVYFVYVDNPNNEFRHMYTAPKANDLFSNGLSGRNLTKFSTPFEGHILLANKGVGGVYDVNPIVSGYIREVMETYIVFIKDINPDVQFTDDFLTHYTRPFNIKWQTEMGLSDFMDAKFGLIDRSVRYLH